MAGAKDLDWHVFKRLKFLGNKVLSQVTTLAFLAVWHGTHSGYLLCFSMEFIIVNVERQYAADAQDKHWLAERQHMRATGGKMPLSDASINCTYWPESWNRRAARNHDNAESTSREQ
ncbi:hypothetical protein DPEC_G00363480 [Dallia pectoralis]|nr:hypothetical protein DPEC_G00363480 [Dallia pectoralis]